MKAAFDRLRSEGITSTEELREAADWCRFNLEVTGEGVWVALGLAIDRVRRRWESGGLSEDDLDELDAILRFWIEEILSERVDAGDGLLRVSAALDSVLDRDLLDEAEPPPIDPSPDSIQDAVQPMRWLLRRIGPGQALTQNGNLNRALVREAAHELGWWHSELFEPQREAEVPPLEFLHRSARSLRWVRRTGRRLTVTKAGAAVIDDAVGMWRALASRVIPADAFGSLLVEAVAGGLLRGLASPDELTHAARSILMEHGWRDRGSEDIAFWPLSTEISLRLSHLEALHVLEWSRRSGGGIRLTASGRLTLREALGLI